MRKLSLREKAPLINNPTKAVTFIAILGVTAYSLYKIYQTLDKLDKIEFDFDTDLMLCSLFKKD